MVKAVKIDKRGVHIRRLALLAGSVWLARKAIGAGRYSPLRIGARMFVPKLVRRAITP